MIQFSETNRPKTVSVFMYVSFIPFMCFRRAPSIYMLYIPAVGRIDKQEKRDTTTNPVMVNGGETFTIQPCFPYLIHTRSLHPDP